jgi:hypothetical protein
MSLDCFETELIRMEDEKLIEFLRYNDLLVSGIICEDCGQILSSKNYTKQKMVFHGNVQTAIAISIEKWFQ